MNPFRQVAAIVALVLALLAAGCQQATNTNTENPGSQTTKKMVIDLPASLTPSSEPGVAGSFSRTVSESGGYSSAGYATLYSAVSMVKNFAPGVATFSVMADALIRQNALTPSATTRSGLKITVTQAMIDEITASLPEGFQAGASLPPVGSEQVMPDFVYNTSSNDKFDYVMVLTVGQGGSAMTENVYWNTDWTRFGLSMDTAGMTMSIATDLATNSSCFKIGGSINYEVKFKGDPTAVNTHGVFVSLASSMTMGETTIASQVVGYGDDNGGAVNFNTTYNGSPMAYSESFNASGQVTYQAYTVSGNTVTNFGAPSTTYSGKLSNTDFGEAPTLFE